MTLSVQGIITMLVIGLVIGGIAAIITRGRALVTYLIGGVVGSIAGGLWLPDLFDVSLYNLIASKIVFGAIGAIVLVVAVRLVGLLPTRLGR